MRGIRLLLLTLTALLVVGVGLLVARSLESIRDGESMRHQIVADRMFDAMEEELSDIIEAEEARSFLEYRFFYAPEGGRREALTRSPLSRRADRDFVVGYFQLEPDGSLNSPRRPRDAERAIDVYGWSETPDLPREEQRLSGLTAGLRDQMAERWEALLEEGVVLEEPEPASSTRRFADPSPVRTETTAPADKKQTLAPISTAKRKRLRKAAPTPTPENRNQKAVLDTFNRGAAKRADRATKSEPVSTDNAYFQLPEDPQDDAVVDANLPQVAPPQDLGQVVESMPSRQSAGSATRSTNRRGPRLPSFGRRARTSAPQAELESDPEPRFEASEQQKEEDEEADEEAVVAASDADPSVSPDGSASGSPSTRQGEIWPGEDSGSADEDDAFAVDRRTVGVRPVEELPVDGSVAAREAATGFEAEGSDASANEAASQTTPELDSGSSDSEIALAAKLDGIDDGRTGEPQLGGLAGSTLDTLDLGEWAGDGDSLGGLEVLGLDLGLEDAASASSMNADPVVAAEQERAQPVETSDGSASAGRSSASDAPSAHPAGSTSDQPGTRVEPEMSFAGAMSAAGPASDFVDVRISPLAGLRVDEEHLVLHRAVRVGELTWRQGLVLRVPALVEHLQAEVLDEELIDFVDLRWNVPPSHGPAEAPLAGLFRFGHHFAAPFTALAATATLSKLPQEGRDPQSWVLLLSLLLGVIGVVGFGALYRMVSVVVQFAERRANFVAAVSHELKTPLTAIRMYGEILREGMVPSEEKRQEYYGTITAESERLSRLIDNVLELSRLEKGTRTVHATVGSIGPVLEEVARILRPHARKMGFELELQVAADLPAATFDRDALQQVLINLVDNALKFACNAEDKIVTLACERAGDELVLRVRDRGPGVPSVQVGRVFQPFFRGERELTRRTKGTGIGLALVKGLVEQMGGRVAARNHPGGGFEVSIALGAGVG